MYIGPWQEYNLSKTQQQQQLYKLATNKREHALNLGELTANNLFKKEIISVLEENLQPDVAEKTIRALDNLFEQQGSNNIETRSNQTQSVRTDVTKLPKIINDNQRYMSKGNRNGRVISHSRALQSIKVSPDGEYFPSLPSTRSTKSEPIQASRMLYTPENDAIKESFTTETTISEPNKGLNKLSSKQNNNLNSGYNASNVVEILRLERNAAKAEATRNKFASFWKWKDPSSSSENIKPDDATSVHIDKNKSSSMPIVDNKMEAIKKMKTMYIEAINEQKQQNERQHPNMQPRTPTGPTGIRLSPIQSSHYQKPKTPLVADKELTSNDLNVVSKYFKKPEPFKPSVFSPAKHLSSSYNAAGLIVSPIRDYGSEKIHSQHLQTSPRVKDSNPNVVFSDDIEDDQNDLSTAEEPVPLNMDFNNDMDINSYLLANNSIADSLIKWSAELNLNNIDDLY